jgi:hypothetical protein
MAPAPSGEVGSVDLLYARLVEADLDALAKSPAASSSDRTAGVRVLATMISCSIFRALFYSREGALSEVEAPAEAGAPVQSYRCGTMRFATPNSLAAVPFAMKNQATIFLAVAACGPPLIF